MLKKLLIVTVPFVLSACATNVASDASISVHATNLQHHNWELVQIDGIAINTPENFDAPRIEIGENLTVNGNAACNNFFGQGELNQDSFRIEQMGMTMKMCPEQIMTTEMTITQVLSDWSQVKLTESTIVFEGKDHTLTYQLKEWVN